MCRLCYHCCGHLSVVLVLRSTRTVGCFTDFAICVGRELKVSTFVLFVCGASAVREKLAACSAMTRGVVPVGARGTCEHISDLKTQLHQHPQLFHTHI